MINSSRLEREQNRRYWWNTEFYFENVILKDWFIFVWEGFIILSLTFLMMLLNQIPFWVTKEVGGVIDPIFSYPLRDNIIYMSFSLFASIGISIFIGIFTEMGQYAGKFGSALFVLVPSFLWLFSDRGSDNIVDIFSTSEFVIKNGFYLAIILLVVMAILQAVRFVVVFSVPDKWIVVKFEFWIAYLNRLLIIFANIIMVLLLGVALINYGIFSLNLADVEKTLPKDPGYDFQSSNFIMYIAFVAIVFAGIMVGIGVISSFGDKEIKKYQKKLAHRTRKLYSHNSYFTGEFSGFDNLDEDKKKKKWYNAWFINIWEKMKKMLFKKKEKSNDVDDDYHSDASAKPRGSLHRQYWTDEEGEE